MHCAQAEVLRQRQALRVVRRQALAVRSDAASAALRLTDSGAVSAFQTAMASMPVQNGYTPPSWQAGERLLSDPFGGEFPAGSAAAGAPAQRDAAVQAAAAAVNAAEAAMQRPAALPEGFPVMVSLDVSEQGFLELELVPSLCLGPVSEISRHIKFLEGPRREEVQDLYSDPELLACLGGCVPTPPLLLFPGRVTAENMPARVGHSPPLPVAHLLVAFGIIQQV